jgi:hypothetical protein
MKDEALKLALEALESERPYLGAMPSKTAKAIEAIKQARSAPVQPVAWPRPEDQPIDNGPDCEDGPDEEGFSGPRPWNSFAQPAPVQEPDDSDINQIHEANAQVRYETWTPAAQPAPVPTSWMEMVTVNLLREGVNKHKARELAEHFYGLAPAQPATEKSSATQPAPVEPLEYWNAVEGWVKIDEVREHFDSVGCGTIYKTAGDGRVPLTAAQRQWVGLETLIPEGWRFYTADFSMQATGKRNCGSVMLIRDEKGVAEWHKLPADLKESDDGPPLYLSGTGKTLQEAIEEASARAIEAKLKEKNT